MGITGLWPLLEPTCQPITLESLEGKKLAVDVSIWIYQAQLGYSAETRSPHLALLINRLCKLLFYKIRPVFVFDGPNVPIFKKRVLEERRLRKHADDLVINKDQKRHLENLAKGPQTDADIEYVKNKLMSPTKKIRTDEEMFNVPSTSKVAPTDVVELSDDEDADLIVDKEITQFTTIMSRKQREDGVDALITERERIRQSRLRPHQIPADSQDFSKFQLQRLLTRGRMNEQIKQMTEQNLRTVTGNDVRFMSKEGRNRMHVFSYDVDPDCQIVEQSSTNTRELPELGSFGLTLDHLSAYGHDTKLTTLTNPEESSEESDQEAQEQLAEIAQLDDGGYLSKTGMIENLMKRRIGHERADAVAVRMDEWSSSGSESDGFIEVNDDLPEYLKKKPTTSIEKKQATPDVQVDNSSQEFNSSYDEPWIEREAEREQIVERDAGAYKDLQDFLTACGFPWIESPGEAEAQCVELERLGLVQGVVSDDSDVWAFGASQVYRHLFSKKKNVQYYSSRRIEKETGLSQVDVVAMAMLSGGDYAEGLRGIGIVAAIELISEFASGGSGSTEKQQQIYNIVHAIEEWIQESETAANEGKKALDSTTIRRKLRAVIEKNNEIEYLQGMSNKDIINAYLKPVVDSSTEQFRWKTIDIQRIKTLLYNQLGWDEDKVQKNTMDALQKWNDFVMGKTSYQKHITSYASLSQSTDEQKVALTKRVAQALERLAKKKGHIWSEEPSLICQATFVDSGSANANEAGAKAKPTGRPLRSIPKKKTAIKRGAAKGKNAKPAVKKQQQLELSEESSFDED